MTTSNKFYWTALAISAGLLLIGSLMQQSSYRDSVHENEETWGHWERGLQDTVEEPEFDKQDERLKQLAQKLASLNVYRAWELTKTIPATREKMVFSAIVMNHWGHTSPLEALEHARELPDGEMRLMITNSALEGWASISPLQALHWATINLSAYYRRTAYAQIGEVWAVSQPEKAADWGMGLNNEVERIFYVTEVLETWAERFPLDAASWVSNLPLGEFHDLMMSKVVSVWVQHYPRMTVDWLRSKKYFWLLPNAMRGWARFDHAAAISWLSSVADKDLIDLCNTSILTEWAVYNPTAAYEWSEANLEGKCLIEARRNILGSWACDDPLGVLKWSQDLQSLDKRTAALELIFETWALSDLISCEGWVNKQPDGIYRDTGLSKMAEAMLDTDPEAAIKIALSIGNSKAKKSCLIHLIEVWKSRDQARAQDWLLGHSNVLELVKQ